MGSRGNLWCLMIFRGFGVGSFMWRRMRELEWISGTWVMFWYYGEVGSFTPNAMHLGKEE